MNKVYVLTELVNDYYQHGEYFLGVFKDIPTLEDVNAWCLFWKDLQRTI